jgi:flagellar biosynthesis/type III secretory pathway protein FliH
MSDAVFITPQVFQLVLKNPAQATVSQTDRPKSELVLLQARCAALTESERVLKAQLTQAQTQVKALGASFAKAFEASAAALEQTALRELTALSVRLAEVILRHQLPDPEMIQGVIRQILTPLSEVRGARVRLNPVDAKALARDQAAGPASDLIGLVEIVVDPKLAPGDVALDTPHGYFNARISERLKLLEEQLGERARVVRCASPPDNGEGRRTGPGPQ